MKIIFFVNVAMVGPPPGGAEDETVARRTSEGPHARTRRQIWLGTMVRGSVRPSGTLDHAGLLVNESVTAF